MHIHIVVCCGVKRLPTSYQNVGVASLMPTCLQSFIHPRVTQHACSHCSLLWCENGIVYQQVIRMLQFHTSKHLGKRVTQTCMFTLFFVVVRKGYCLPTSYQNVGVVSVFPIYLFTKFHASKHFDKRVTQTCMPYCNVWAEVVYCGFPKSKVFTKTLMSLFPARHQSLYLHQI